MYRAFQDQKNIEKMVRRIEVLFEQETLEITLLSWKGSPYKNYGNWVKYVSVGTKNKRDVFLYWDAKVENEFLAEIEKRLTHDKKYFSWLERYFLNSYKAFGRLSDTYFRKGRAFFASLSDTELLQHFATLHTTSQGALVGYYIVYDITHLLTKRVPAELATTFPLWSAKKRDAFFRDISTVGITSIVQEEKRAFLVLLQKLQAMDAVQRKQQTEKLLFHHWYKFGSCVYSHKTNRLISLAEYRKKLRRYARRSAKRELERMEKQSRAEHTRVQKLLVQIQKSPQLKKHVRWLRIMMEHRNNKSLFHNASYYHAMPVYEEIARRLHLALQDFWFLSREEIVDGISHHRSVQRIVEQRKKRGFTIKQVGRRIHVLTGVRPEDWHEQKVERAQEVRGMTAYPGTVQGIAKIVTDPHRAGILGSNDILVTAMTTPEFVPLMHNVRAIVTDEGGMLCHAAIVAREMHKPCVIGTKTATRILHNGDQIEVDATNGVVRKLQQSPK